MELTGCTTERKRMRPTQRPSRRRRLTGGVGFDAQSSRLSPPSFDPIGESVDPPGSRILWMNLEGESLTHKAMRTISWFWRIQRAINKEDDYFSHIIIILIDSFNLLIKI